MAGGDVDGFGHALVDGIEGFGHHASGGEDGEDTGSEPEINSWLESSPGLGPTWHSHETAQSQRENAAMNMEAAIACFMLHPDD